MFVQINGRKNGEVHFAERTYLVNLLKAAFILNPKDGVIIEKCMCAPRRDVGGNGVVERSESLPITTIWILAQIEEGLQRKNELRLCAISLFISLISQEEEYSPLQSV